jgi:hypothetical protein
LTTSNCGSDTSLYSGKAIFPLAAFFQSIGAGGVICLKDGVIPGSTWHNDIGGSGSFTTGWGNGKERSDWLTSLDCAVCSK